MKGGFDANLELPLGDPYWKSLFKSENSDVTSMHDLDTLTAALLEHRIRFLVSTFGQLLLFAQRPFLAGLASALSPRTKALAQSSVFVVTRSNPATSLQQLKGANLGYINTYCTTSYFAP